MKNLLNLGKALNKNEQKAINGGLDNNFGDVDLPENGPTGCAATASFTDRCICINSGKYWNAECERCEDLTERYLDFGDCVQHTL